MLSSNKFLPPGCRKSRICEFTLVNNLIFRAFSPSASACATPEALGSVIFLDVLDFPSLLHVSQGRQSISGTGREEGHVYRRELHASPLDFI